MNFLHLIYNLLGTGVGLTLIPPLLWYHRNNKSARDRLHQRLGFYPAAIQKGFRGRPLVWIHAVSVGEVGVAAAIVEGLRDQIPDCSIAISATTQQGLERARKHFQGQATCFYAPVDLIASARKALQTVRPNVLALLETEIWPNLIINARRLGVRTAVLNGRISVRTIQRYQRIRSLMQYTLSHIDTFSMISTEDAQRILSLGAEKQRVAVNGNAKFDGPDPCANGEDTQRWAKSLYGLQEKPPVFVAGSTRDPEERIILDAFLRIRRTFGDAVLIMAPRHIDRVAQIEQWIAEKGLTCQRRTSFDGISCHRTAQVVLLDTMGELSATYSVADLVFCGGSLVPKGGQNVLEAALWAKPVMYGPSMEDFADAQKLIDRAGGGFTIHNAEQIAGLAVDWLRCPKAAASAGLAARRAIPPRR